MRTAGLAHLDPRRLFNDAEKSVIWERAGGMCALCSKPLSVGEEEYHHITPWIHGGPTTVDNGQAVHRACNRHRGQGELAQAA